MPAHFSDEIPGHTCVTCSLSTFQASYPLNSHGHSAARLPTSEARKAGHTWGLPAALSRLDTPSPNKKI